MHWQQPLSVGQNSTARTWGKLFPKMDVFGVADWPGMSRSKLITHPSQTSRHPAKNWDACAQLSLSTPPPRHLHVQFPLKCRGNKYPASLCGFEKSPCNLQPSLPICKTGITAIPTPYLLYQSCLCRPQIRGDMNWLLLNIGTMSSTVFIRAPRHYSSINIHVDFFQIKNTSMGALLK